MCPLPCPGLSPSLEAGFQLARGVSQPISLSRGTQHLLSVSGQSSGMRTALPDMSVIPQGPLLGTRAPGSHPEQAQKPDARKHCGQIPKVGTALP